MKKKRKEAEVVRNIYLGLDRGLSQKTVFAPGSQKIFSFFNSNKKLQSNFLFELKKENEISCRWQSVVF